MKTAILFFLLGIITGIAGTSTANAGIAAVNKPDSLPGHILVINTFDASEMKARKNKKELFGDLADSLKQVLSSAIQTRHSIRVTVLRGIFPETITDSSIFSLIANNNATKAIVVRKIDVHFVQTRVEVTGTKNDKSRTAYYDICSIIHYDLYKKEMKLDQSEIKHCEYYTKRSVVSGLLAAGPDIVGKSKDAFKIMIKNSWMYLSEIFSELSKE